MKTSHPTPEEWISFLYRESAPEQQAPLEQHLHACAECRTKVRNWRRTMHELDAWQEEDVRPHPARRRAVGWATAALAAAAVLLLSGIALGRLWRPSPLSGPQLQASLRTYMDTQLAAAKADLAQVLEKRQSDMAEALRSAASSSASEEARTLLAQYAQAIEDQRLADRAAYLAAFHQLDEQRQTDLGRMREQLETVAVNADDGLSQTREQLLHLASAGQNQP